MEDWALIRRLVADGVPQRQVARQLGIGRSTVARAVVSAGPPRYERKPVTTSFTAFEPRVRVALGTIHAWGLLGCGSADVPMRAVAQVAGRAVPLGSFARLLTRS